MIGEKYISPKIYFDLKKLIDEESNKKFLENLPPILEFKEFELISGKINIIGRRIKKRTFSCLYFSKDSSLNKYIILNSQWLADTMATLITTKGKFIKKRINKSSTF